MAGSEIPYGVRFALNALTHVAILWFALLLLFVFVISGTETDALQGQFEKAATSNLSTALNDANVASGGLLKATLTPLKESLQTIEKIYNKPDGATKQFNHDLIIIGIMIGIVFLSVLVGMLLTMKVGLGIPVGRTYGFILLENMFLFLFIAGAELSFFKLVATKYIPIKASEILEDVISDLKKVFV